MIKTINDLKQELSDYSDPINKVHRMIKEGKLLPLTKGVYETNRHAEPFALARAILSPSYISFESALSYHGLIPERVYSVTSASLCKNKNKEYRNVFATFTYSDIPERVFPLGVTLVSLNDGYSYHIASKEKALCDKLYKLPVIKNYNDLTVLLFDDLRIDFDELMKFDLGDMEVYFRLYRSKNVTILYKYLRRLKHHDHSNWTNVR